MPEVRERTIFSIGHSNRSAGELLSLLREFHIAAVADVRRFPASRHCPQFNRDVLETSLSTHGIEYHWFESLGGRRSETKAERSRSPNTGLANPAFLSYADYMMTPEFQQGIRELVRLAERVATAFMCAEAVYWRCHRRLISDYLTAQGVSVLHILGPGTPTPHRLTPGAVITDEKRVLYPTPLELKTT